MGSVGLLTNIDFNYLYNVTESCSACQTSNEKESPHTKTI